MPKSQISKPLNNLTNSIDDRILYPWQYLEYLGDDNRILLTSQTVFTFLIKQVEDSLMDLEGCGM